jgi:hypothetical protein
VFVPPEGQPTSVVMTIQEGIQLLDFRSASLQSEPPVFDSGP